MKQTEIGLIPDDWEVKKLSEIGTFCKGSGISREESNTGELPAIRYGELYTTHNDYIKSFKSHISNEVASKSRRLKQGDLLFTCSGETKEDIGKCVAFIGSERAYAGGDLLILSPTINIDSLFYGFLLNTNIAVKQKSAMAQGDAIVHISTESIGKVLVPLPPLAEQHRIAKALSDVDALISTTEKLIQKKKNIKQGAMQNLLTGKKRLPGFAKSTNYKQTELGPIPEDWEVKNIGITCNVITGGEAPAIYSKDKNTLYKYPIYSNGREVYGYHTNYTIDHDAVCISSIGENTGDIFYYQKNFTPIIRLKVIIPKKSNIDTEFLYYCLKTIKIDTTKNGGIPNINSNDVKSINYIQPTNKEEQTAIANILSSMDKEMETLNTKLEKYRNLKTAMMQQLLTGKIRLM